MNFDEKDVIDYEMVCKHLDTKYIGRNYIYYDTIDSTNIQCKKQCSNKVIEGITVVAEEQSTGRGRLGRHWESPKSTGIWMTIGLAPKVLPEMASKITIIAAAAVYKALKELNIDCGIKWPNDIVINGKKICGILTEMNTKENEINYVVVGIGINVNMDCFPEELKEKATSLKKELGHRIDRAELLGKVLNYFEKYYDLFKDSGDISLVNQVCKKASVVIGKDVKIISRNEEILCKVVDIDEDGQLIVRYEDNSIHKVFSGEVSVRGLYGYL